MYKERNIDAALQAWAKSRIYPELHVDIIPLYAIAQMPISL